MASVAALEAAYENIIKATNPWSVFGDLGQNKLSALQTSYRYLCQTVHPDLYQNDPKASHMANEAMRELNQLRKLARLQIDDGTYSPNSASSFARHHTSNSNLVVGDYAYEIFPDVIQGDFCSIMFGNQTHHGGNVEPVVLKIPLERSDNDLIQNEALLLNQIHHKSLPFLINTFTLDDGRKVNVLRLIENGFDLVAVKSKFPNGLPLEHVVWIMDRLLSVLGFIHINNAIHGMIEPGNIIIVPSNHNGILIDYLFAVQSANSKGAKYKGENNYSAPEVIKNKHISPHPSSDMFSLGLSILFLSGGDIDTHSFAKHTDVRFNKFLAEFLVSDPSLRASDAWVYHQKLKALRTELFGSSSQFLKLNIP
jgi:hypothetical protein